MIYLMHKQKQLFTKHVLVQKHLVPNELSLCLSKNFIFELDSHFPQKCMIGREIIKQNGTNYAS